jgi:hypothetical protein
LSVAHSFCMITLSLLFAFALYFIKIKPPRVSWAAMYIFLLHD